MTVSLPQDKFSEIQLMVLSLSLKPTATLKNLHTLMEKLLYISQVYQPVRLFLNRLLDTLRQCPEK